MIMNLFLFLCRFRIYIFLCMQVLFAVGKVNTDYAGYRMLTAAEWRDAAVGARLLATHASGGGWSLLEEPLVGNWYLHVAEGYVLVDGAYIAEVNFINYDNSELLHGRYPAMNYDTGAHWAAAVPSLRRWDVEPCDVDDEPCLYIRQVRGAARLVFCRQISPDVADCWDIVIVVMFFIKIIS